MSVNLENSLGNTAVMGYGLQVFLCCDSDAVDEFNAGYTSLALVPHLGPHD